MEKRIALELRARSPSQVKELNLDNCRSTNIVGLTDAYVNLETLSLNNVGLTSLKGFPSLPNLKRLELSDNRISNGLNFLNGSPNLVHLNLSNNKIKEINDLKPLEDFKKLKNLDLFNNEVTSVENYRTKVFAMNASLKYLDGFDQDDQEAEDSEGEEEEAANGNDESDEEEDVALDFSTMALDENEPCERNVSLPIAIYTIYSLLFHMGTLLKCSEEDDDDLSLSAVYKDNLDEESSDGSVYDGSDVEEEDEDIDEDGDIDTTNNSHDESTRGKKRKHDDDGETN